MTKLLYIPTGEFITFFGFHCFTEELEHIDHDEYEEWTRTIHTLIPYIVTSRDLIRSKFSRRNKLKYPVCEEEFEIIYDEER